MFVIKKQVGYVLNEKTQKPKLFATTRDAQSYAELSHMRGATVEPAKEPEA